MGDIYFNNVMVEPLSCISEKERCMIQNNPELTYNNLQVLLYMLLNNEEVELWGWRKDKKTYFSNSGIVLQVSYFINYKTVEYLVHACEKGHAMFYKTDFVSKNLLSTLDIGEDIVDKDIHIEEEYLYLKSNAELSMKVGVRESFKWNREQFSPLYRLLKQGCTEKEISNTLSELGIQDDVTDLLNTGIIVKNHEGILDVFSNQRLYSAKRKSKKALKYMDKDFYKTIKEIVQKEKPMLNGHVIKLCPDEEILYELERRESDRCFSEEAVTLENFSNVLQVFARKENGKFCYPATGGLYTVDIYMYLKENAVKGLPKGVYYFDKIDNSIMLLDDISLENNFHTVGNRDIFNHSLGTVFLVEDMNYKQEKYGALGLYFSCLDVGIMAATLAYSSNFYGCSTCSIGTWSKNPLEYYLSTSKELMHIIEFGKKREKK